MLWVTIKSHVNYVGILFITMENYNQTTKKEFDASVLIYVILMVTVFTVGLHM